jgi:hypothetical protein
MAIIPGEVLLRNEKEVKDMCAVERFMSDFEQMQKFN